jgi:hypothetical protein
MKGYSTDILRGSYRSSINVMKDVDEVTIIDPKVLSNFEPTEKSPAVRIVRRDLFGEIYIHAEPYEEGFYAFGGSYIKNHDLNRYPIALHDRDMSKENQ